MSFEQKEYFLAGKRAERERILALLASEREGGKHDSEHWGHCICSGHFQEMLEVIRGD